MKKFYLLSCSKCERTGLSDTTKRKCMKCQAQGVVEHVIRGYCNSCTQYIPESPYSGFLEIICPVCGTESYHGEKLMRFYQHSVKMAEKKQFGYKVERLNKLFP